MNTSTLRRWLALSLFQIGSLLGFQQSLLAQTPCLDNFPPGGGTATITITSPWINSSFIVNTNATSYFIDQVTVGDAEVPAGTYVGWCIDVADNIGSGTTSYASTLLFSSCDTNLDAELEALGLNYPLSVYVTPQVWDQINYILNHKNGDYFWNVQLAIWSLIGGPIVPANEQPPYPPTDTNEVNALLAAASANASSWDFQCGDVIAVIVAELTGDASNPVQLTMIEVPFQCPTLSIGAIGSCYTNLASADAAALAATTGTATCGGTNLTLTVTNNGLTCPATITVTGTDNCGNSTNASCTATILTNPPTLSGTPANTNVVCVEDIPIPATVTATDSCGTSLLVSYVQNESDAASSCSNVITRTWSTVDCAGQPASYTQVIAQLNNVTPILNNVPSGSNYGCNPANIPTTNSVLAGVTATDDCTTTPATISAAVGYATNICGIIQTFTITAIDACSNTATAFVTNIWTANATPPAINGLPPGTNYGCNPTNVPSSITGLSASNACGTAAITQTNTVTTNGCQATQLFIIVATDACGNTATAYVTNTWTANTVTPVLGGVPIGANLGCNPASVPTLASVQASVYSTNDTCSPATVHVTGGIPVTNGCGVIQIFTIIATNVCGNTATAFVTNTWTANPVMPVLSGVPIGVNLGCNPPSVPTLASVQAVVSSTNDTCSPATVHVTGGVPVTNGCGVVQIFTIIATNVCGNTAVAHVTNTWVANTTAPVLSGVPAGTNYVCGAPASVPTVASVQAAVSSTNDTCSPATVHVTGGVPVTNGCQVIQIFTIIATNACGNTVTAYVTNTWNSGTGPVVQCPTNVTIITNLCQICCTFTPNDWCSPCIGYNTTGCNNNNWSWNWRQNYGWNTYGNNWWTTWTQNNPPTNCWPSWSNWWWSCNGTAPGANWWGNWTNIGNGNHWSGCWTAQTSGNWWNTWANNNTYGNQSWVPCGGNNPGDILTNCFGTVYSNGCVQIGQPGSGYCATFTSPAAVRNCLNFTGNPGVFNCNATNPTNCSAGSFCSQVLALQMNVNFGDCSYYAPSFFGRCGDSVLTDSTSPCNGKTVREILADCNTALGCGSLPQGCTLSNLCCLASNLNQCFEGCKVSSWCGKHLARVYIPPPSQTGTATVTDTCSPNPTLTYCDVVATNSSCPGNYVITRTWLAVDACGNSNSCSQTITIEQGSSSGVSGAVVLACSGDTNLNDNVGISNVTVTLKNSSGATVATTTTGATGAYSFPNLQAGTYTVTVTPPSGYSQTSPSGSSNSQTVTLSGCQIVCGLSFGYNGSTPAVCITKTGPKCISHGQTATYCFAVTNTGNTCLNLKVNDPLLGGIIFTQSAVAPGQGYVFSTNYVVTQTNGTLTNTAWAIGTPPAGGAVSNQATTIATVTTKCITNTICGNFNSQNPSSGWLWCNAHVSGNPGKKVTVFCQNASVTLTCNNGQTYTYPIPNGQINFSPSCTVATNWFDGTQWNTTLPCGGDSGIFLQGCGIPWQSAFANCHTVCWTGVFSCDTAGFNCNWQWGAACYNNTQPSCGSIGPKACTQTSCPNGQYYSSGDLCGAPENCKPYCVAGATGGGGSNCTGSWSSTGSCSF